MELSQIVEVLQVRTSIRHNGLWYYKTLKSKRQAETQPREHLKIDVDVGFMGPKANHCDWHVNCAPNGSSSWTPLVPKWWHCWERLQNLQEVELGWRKWVTKGRALRFYLHFLFTLHFLTADTTWPKLLLSSMSYHDSISRWHMSQDKPFPFQLFGAKVLSQLWEKELIPLGGGRSQPSLEAAGRLFFGDFEQNMTLSTPWFSASRIERKQISVTLNQ